MDVAGEHESGCECDGVDDGGDVAVWKVVESLDEGPDSDGRDTFGWRWPRTHALLLLLLLVCVVQQRFTHTQIGRCQICAAKSQSCWRCSAFGRAPPLNFGTFSGLSLSFFNFFELLDPLLARPLQNHALAVPHAARSLYLSQSSLYDKESGDGIDTIICEQAKRERVRERESTGI